MAMLATGGSLLNSQCYYSQLDYKKKVINLIGNRLMEVGPTHDQFRESLLYRGSVDARDRAASKNRPAATKLEQLLVLE